MSIALTPKLRLRFSWSASFGVVLAVWFMCASESVWASAKYDSSQLNSGTKTERPREEKISGPDKKGDVKNAQAEEAAAELDKLRMALGGFNQILKNQKVNLKNLDMFLNRAAAAQRLGTYYSLQTGAKAKQRAEGFLRISDQDTSAVIRFGKGKTSQKSRAFFLSGLTAVARGQQEKANQSFDMVLTLAPRSRDAVWIKLFLAESAFEQGDFLRAFDLYVEIQKNAPDEKDKELALYKKAWCEINLDRTSAAIQSLSHLLEQHPKGVLRREATRDLGVVIPKVLNEDQILNLGKKLLPDRDERLSLFLMSLQQLFSYGKVLGENPLLLEVLKLERDTVRRMQIRLTSLEPYEKGFASQDHHTYYLKVVEEVEKIKKKSQFQSVSLQLLGATERVMRAYLDTFAKRVQSPENISNDELAKRLQIYFQIYLNYFPDSKNLDSIIGLWLDVCIEVKESRCVLHVTDQVLSRKSMRTLHSRARWERLAALEILVKADEGKHVRALLEELDRYVKTDREPKEKWLQAAKRLYALRTQKGIQKSDLALIQSIDKIEVSNESLYNLILALFKVEQFEDVLSARNPQTQGQFLDQIQEVRREASLKLAAVDQKKGDIDAFRRRVDTFLATQPPSEKADLVRSEFLAELYKKDPILALKEWESWAEPIRRGSQVKKVYNQGAQGLLAKRSFELFLKWTASARQDHAFDRGLASLSLGRSPFEELKTVDAKKQAYLAGHVIWKNPDWVDGWLKVQNPWTDEHRRFYLMMKRLKAREWNVNLSPEERKRLGAIAPPVNKRVVSKVVGRYEQIFFPTSSESVNSYNKKVEASVARIRELRKLSLQELKTLEPAESIPLIRKAEESEKRLAQIILEAPTPAELGPDQIPQYRAGLAELAKEFETNAVEFSKLMDRIQQRSEESVKAELELDPGLVSAVKWPWPDVYQSQDFLEFRSGMKNQNLALQLYELDVLRTSEKMTDQDFFLVRSGVILELAGQSTVVRRYLALELKALGQTSTLAQWREIAGGGNQ